MPTETLAPLTAADRALLRRRAVVVVPVGAVFGAAIVWMLVRGVEGLAVAIRMGFGLFFGAVLLFIVGVHLGSAFEREKRVRQGVVTGKRVGIIGASFNSNDRTSPRYYLSLDGEERNVEQWVYERVRTGQTVELHSTARLRNLFDVVVLADPAEPAALPAPEPLDLAGIAHEEPLSGADRAVLRGHAGCALVRRTGGGVVLGAIAWAGLVVIWAVSREPGNSELDLLVLGPGGGLLALSVLVALNVHTLNLLQDHRTGRKRVVTEIVRDVVRSNTPLLSPRAVITGTGLDGDYAWIQTHARWLRVPLTLADTLTAGSRVRVATAPKSGVVLAVDGQSAPTPTLFWLDWLCVAIVVAALGCLLAPAPAPPNPWPDAM